VEIQQRQQQTAAGWSTGRERAGGEPERLVLGFWLVRSASGLEMEGESQPGLYGRTSIHLPGFVVVFFFFVGGGGGGEWYHRGFGLQDS
jgi:hypothetical protein